MLNIVKQEKIYFMTLENDIRNGGQDINGYFSKLRIKQYKNYVDHNILWIK